jgi:glycosyltransferase involved in cell wall biosynthesis
VPLVSISDRQRAPMPHLNFAATILHGMPRDLLRPVSGGDGGYFAFLGRFSPEKGIEPAIEIAARGGAEAEAWRPRSARKRTAAYYEHRIEPLLAQGGVEYVGEIDDGQKPAFLLGSAGAAVPDRLAGAVRAGDDRGDGVRLPGAIAFRKGSVPEVIEEGRTGFIVDHVDEAVAACLRLGKIDRAGVRRRFEERWTAERMGRGIIGVVSSG